MGAPLHPERRARLDAVRRRLAETVDDTRTRAPLEPVWSLLQIILAQQASGAGRETAWRRIREPGPDPSWLAELPEEALIEIIRPAGLARQKAPRMQALLRHLQKSELGYDLAGLSDWPLDAARDWLEALPGVGPLSAALVLSFDLGMPALPVNTGMLRNARRLGIVPPGASASRAQALLEPEIPAQARLAFHVAMVEHAREICRARAPRCELCVLAEHCAFLGAT